MALAPLSQYQKEAILQIVSSMGDVASTHNLESNLSMPI
jgi:uncharacterized protein YejL (UPF0352 family)